MNPSDLRSKPVPLSPEETDALNKHGVFFKKRILQELSEISGVSIVAEELGVSFGETRVIDIVALDARFKPKVTFVFECKRAYAMDRKWIFFQDDDRRFRMLRKQTGLTGNSSLFADWFQNQPPVCSEGYEFKKNESKADQDPIFKAASQLSAGFLGFIARRERDMHPRAGPPAEIQERYVPVLVTNAELVVVERDLSATSLESGNIPIAPTGTSVDILILKHPFPTPEGMERDFRDEHNPALGADPWSQLHKESIFVVRASALAKFVKGDYRDYLSCLEPQSR